MRILIITNSIRPDSGRGRYSREIISELKRQGQEVVIAISESSEGECINISDKMDLFSFLSNLIKIRGASKNCDVIHALDGWPYGVYAYFATLGTNKLLFINGVGTYSVAPLYSKVKGFLLKLSYKSAKQVFTISNYVKDQIVKLTSIKNISVNHMGYDYLPPVNLVEISDHKNTYNYEDRFPVLLTVGEIKDRKGQLDTLKAVSILKGKYPKILYIMVGKTDSKSYLSLIRDFSNQNDLSDNFRIYTEVKSDKELSLFYSSSNLFLLNSTNESGHFEGFGLVILEANQFGIPVVGSSDCGIEDAIKDGLNGFLSKQRDPEDISDKIIKVLNSNLDPHKIMEWSKSFTWKRTIENYIKSYQ